MPGSASLGFPRPLPLALAVTAGLGASGCFGRTPPTSLVCPDGAALAGRRCVQVPLDGGDAGARRDAGPRDAADAGPRDAGRAAVSAQPGRLDFGAVRLASRKTVTLQVASEDGQARAVALRTGDPRLTLSPPRFELGPRGSQPVQVEFRAESLADLDAELVVEACAGGCPLRVPAAGRVLAQALSCPEVRPPPITEGSCAETTLRCRNAADQEGLFVPGLVFGPVAGRVLTERARVPARGEVALRLSVCAPSAGELRGRFEGRVEFPGGAVENVSVPIRVTGVPDRPGCQASFDAVLDFGRVDVGRAGTAELTVENTGRGPCALGPAVLAGPDAGAFRQLEMLPPSLPPRSARDIGFEFRPASRGAKSARFRFGLDDPNGPLGDVELRGEGVLGAPPTRFDIVERAISAPRPPMGRALSFSDRDDGFARVTLPFPFDFLGRTETEVFVSTNGFITFDRSGAGALTNRAIPRRNAPNAMIAWFHDDLVLTGPSSAVTLTVTGRAPRRRAIFAFQGVRRFGGGGVPNGDTELDALVILEEGTNEIAVQYGQATSPTAPSGFDASLGWEDASGARGGSPVGCSPNCGLSDWPALTEIRYRPRP